MAKRRRTRKSNPQGSGMLLMLGGAAVAVYGYTQGWFDGLFGGPAVTYAAIPPPPAPSGNPIADPATQIVNTPSAPPPLGTIVTNANDVDAQLKAKYAYIIPDPSNVNALGGPIASTGYINMTYVLAHDAVTGAPVTATVYVRPDVSAPVQASIDARVARGADPLTSYDTIDQINSVMSTNGLTGIRGRNNLGYTNGWGGYRM